MKKKLRKIVNKRLILCSLIFLQLSAYSQVGIRTESPMTDLDVNGNMAIRGPLKVGTSSNPGNLDDVLISKGEGKAPIWQPYTKNLGPDGRTYILTNVITSKSEKGITLLDDPSASIVNITENMPLPNDWTVMDDLDVVFTVEKESSYITLVFQTSFLSKFIGSIKGSNQSAIGVALGKYIDLVGGIFIAPANLTTTPVSPASTPLLVIGREDRLKGFKDPERIYTIMYSFDDLKPGDYILRVAFRRQSSDSSAEESMKTCPLFIGGTSSTDIPKASPFITSSILKIDLYAPIN